MTEENAVISAESAAAPSSTPATPAPEAPAERSLESLTPKQYENWQLTGKMPEPPNAGESAAPDKEESSAGDGEAAEPGTAPDPESGSPQEKKGKLTAEERKAQLVREALRDRDEARRDREAARKEREDWERTKAARSSTEQPPAKQAQPTTTPKPKPEDLDASGKPKYKDWAEYEDARDEWVRASVKAEVKAEHEAQVAQAAKEKADRELGERWKSRVDAAKGKHDDYESVAFSPDLRIPEGSVTDAFILDSEQGAEILYHLGQNPAELTRISALPPIAQARELVKLEEKFSTPGTPAAPKPPAKTVTSAPRPPREVGGNGMTSKDAVEHALEEGDEAAYMAAQNARDLAKAHR